MGRKRTHLYLTDSQEAQLRRLLCHAADPRARERARFAILAKKGQHTLEEIAELVGRARATIQNWLSKFKSGGVSGLLERHNPPGSNSPIASPAVRAELEAGLEARRWRSAGQVATWLREAHGIRRSRKSVYYWLEKLGGRARSA